MRYGLPYKGSKNAIAKWIIGNLPKADTFVDLFFGGGAVTHVALLSGKYERFVINDIDGRLPKLFLECVYGKHTVDNHSEWVSRSEFHAKKESDAYIALIWSFGNNGIDYIYGADIEDMKHAYHKAVYFDDLDADALIKELRVEAAKDMSKNFDAVVSKIIVNIFCMALEEQPTIEPEQRWIPCGERLPEVGKGVLLTTTFPTMIIGCLKSDGKWMIYENDGNSFQDYIIAWMPLPEPYKEGATC